MYLPWQYGAGIAPYQSDNIMTYNANQPQSSIHSVNTYTSQFFQRYLWQTLIGVLKFNIPETWSYDYFTYALFMYGYVGIINTNKFGVIPQICSLQGYNVFYEPTKILVSNPLLQGIVNPIIGKQCTVIRLNADYGGMNDLITYYADLMALTIESAGINLLNSHLAYVFFADTNAQAETFKAMYDRISSGEPAVVTDSNSKRIGDNDNPWHPFTNNLKQNYLANDMLEALKQIENKFLTEIGVPNSNDQKKERMLVDEINSNNAQTSIATMTRLERIKMGMEQTNKLFGAALPTKLSVEWRINPNFENGGADGDKNTTGRMDNSRR